MASPNALQLPQWNQLTDADKRHQFQQLLRYFVSPLLPISQIRPYHYRFKGYQFNSYQAFIAGFDFVFIPGDAQVKLGLRPQRIHDLMATLPDDGDQVRRQLLTQQTLDMAPMLVVKTPVVLSQQPQGVIAIKTGEFFGDPLFAKRRQGDIQNTLMQLQQTTSDPDTQQLPKQIINPWSISTLMADQAYYQVTTKRPDQTPEQLSQALSQQGMTLLDHWDYLYLRNTKYPQIFPWGNAYQTPTWPVALDTYFGLTYPLGVNQAELLTQGLVGTSGQVSGSRQALSLSPYYLNTQAAAEFTAAQIFYRPMISIVLSDD
ncbi:hypothetical protein FC83_GL000326 [Agrilactobacillus composti DSM 18527 = JCM 14202]|uniref:Uncharacterized protein n=1 Tax=Agrilactobacillus composti DSM 18527 = JCM 14202 TaxID=1423734 RepID=X0PRS7_9LACO|nr:hypothetical protein [Agrilactobacillus composti]KRM32461.1 hypothetical protein FC83_GL000326 [Agrilactobacillus composti DSM 18527 = JCM 14202]GAF39886.1 hypothetical protein JCM14202_1765 [Agrilactobacillus composti DSM 18527 = JCM 14202]